MLGGHRSGRPGAAGGRRRVFGIQRLQLLEHLDVSGGSVLPGQFRGLQVSQGLRWARPGLGVGGGEVTDQRPEALGDAVGGARLKINVAGAGAGEH